jgi:HK97 family phage portal protein
MALFDFLKTPKKIINPRIFGVAFSPSAPEMNAEEYLKAYKGWVYSCTNAIADDVSTIELHLENFQKGDWIEVEHNMVLDLLKNVNEVDTWTDLLVATQSYLELEGNSFWYLPRGKTTRKPAEIWALNPTKVTVVKSETEVVGGYIYQNPKGEMIPIPKEEIIHFKRFNPFNRYRGIGTVYASALAIDIDNYSGQFNRNFFFNAAVPSAVLKTTGEMTEEQYQRLKAEWESRYTGTHNAHRLAILQNGLEYQPIQMTQKEMQFLEQRRFSRDEILAIFRVPKTILGIADDVNRANAETSDYVFARRVVKPRMNFLVSRLNESLLPMFGMDDNLWRFTFDDPVQENEDQEIREHTASLTLGSAWMTPNEVRAEEGLPPIENGDSLLIPLNAIPLGSPIPQVGEEKSVKKALSKVEKLGVMIAGERVAWIVNQIRKREKLYQSITDSIIRDVIENLLKSGIKSVKKSKKDDLISILFVGNDDHIHELESQTDETLKASLKRGGDDTFRQLADKLDTGAEFDATQELASNFIRENGLDSAKKINDTLKGEMRTILSEGVDEGLSVREMADQIEELTGTPSNRAERIARTEVLKGYQEGSLQGAVQSGVVVGKSWLTAGDDRVDEDCLAAETDGVIPLNASFSNGDSAPPDHPNCRCVLQWYSGTEVEFQMFDKVEAHLKRKVADIEKDLQKKKEESRGQLNEMKDSIIREAKEEADGLIAESKDHALKEKSKILDDLAKLREKALEHEYEVES